MQLSVDITDWENEALRDEEFVEAKADIIEQLGKGEHTAKVARRAIVSRERGMAPDDIIKPNKLLLQTGAQLEVSRIARNTKRDVKAESGKTYKAPALLGKVPERKQNGDPDEESYISTHDKRARERAENYLLTVVPGHIWNRLLIIHDNGGDIEGVMKELKSIINKQVYRLLYKPEV